MRNCWGCGEGGRKKNFFWIVNQNGKLWENPRPDATTRTSAKMSRQREPQHPEQYLYIYCRLDFLVNLFTLFCLIENLEQQTHTHTFQSNNDEQKKRSGKRAGRREWEMESLLSKSDIHRRYFATNPRARITTCISVKRKTIHSSKSARNSFLLLFCHLFVAQMKWTFSNWLVGKTDSMRKCY